MSNKEEIPDKETEQAVEQQVEKTEAAEKDAKTSVKIGTLIIFSLIISTLCWYLVSDRFTPYTSQARINGYVIGVSSEVSGVVKHVWAKNNQVIKKGQELFSIDNISYQIALDKTISSLEDVKRQIAASTAGVESAESKLLASLANKKKAQQDVERLNRLYKKDPGAISVRRLESSQASYEQALAKVSGAEAEVARAIEQTGGEGENNAKLKSAISAVDKAKLDLKHTTTYASTSGIITDLRTDIGQFASAGAPVITIISIYDIWIDAEFTENNLGHMKSGTRVELVLDSLPGEVFSGKVRSIGLGVAGRKNPAVGTLPTVENNRDWLRQSQRFPVIIDFDINQNQSLKSSIRLGGQVEVIAFTKGHDFLNQLAKYYIRLMSLFSYVY
jgi:multidrug resistance efflux pump